MLAMISFSLDEKNRLLLFCQALWLRAANSYLYLRFLREIERKELTTEKTPTPSFL